MTVGLPNVWPQYVQYHFIRTPVENRSFVLKSPQKKFSVFFFRISWLFFLSLCFGFRENFECGTRRTCFKRPKSFVFSNVEGIFGDPKPIPKYHNKQRQRVEIKMKLKYVSGSQKILHLQMASEYTNKRKHNTVELR